MGMYAADIKPSKPKPESYAEFKPAAKALIDARNLGGEEYDPRRIDDLAYGLSLFKANGGSTLKDWAFYAKKFPSGAEATPDSLFSMYALDDLVLRKSLGIERAAEPEKVAPSPAASRLVSNEHAEKLGFQMIGGSAFFEINSERQPTARELAKVLKNAAALGIDEVQINRGEAGALCRNSGGRRAEWDVSRFPGGGHTVRNIQKACDLANQQGHVR